MDDAAKILSEMEARKSQLELKSLISEKTELVRENDELRRTISREKSGASDVSPQPALDVIPTIQTREFVEDSLLSKYVIPASILFLMGFVGVILGMYVV